MLIYSTIVPSSTTFSINEIIDPNVDNISIVNDFLSNIQPKDIDDAVLILLANDYIGKLISLFEKYEQDTNQVTLLRSLNGILHILLSWSNTTLIKEFLKEQYVVGFLGILEHDSLKKKILFREQFKTLKRLNLDSSMMDEEMFHKIQETENLEFLKSQMTSHYQPKRYVNLIKLVDKLISWNRLDIIQWIQYDIVYVRYILNLLLSEDQVNIDKCNYVDFLYFILSSSKMEMQPFALATLIRLLLDHGLLNVIHFLVPNENGDIRFKIVFILNLVMEYDLVMVQHYILDQIDKNKHIPTLLQTILEQWTKEDNIDLAKSFYEITQYLLGLIPPLQFQPKVVNKETFFSEDPTLNNIIKLFYSRISTSLFCAFNWIEIKPIHVNGYKDVLEMTENQVIIYGNICELLENMISNNNLPSKTVIQESHFFVRMVQLFRCLDYTVKLKTLRFFMACVRLKEEEYHKLLVRSNFIAAIIGLLLNDELQQDDTLYIESQALFNYIHQNNITILRNHIISEYSISIRPLIASDIIQDPQKPFSENMTN